jgi:hypothetical protein
MLNKGFESAECTETGEECWGSKCNFQPVLINVVYDRAWPLQLCSKVNVGTLAIPQQKSALDSVTSIRDAGHAK